MNTLLKFNNIGKRMFTNLTKPSLSIYSPKNIVDYNTKIPIIQIKPHLTKEKYSEKLNKEGLFLKQNKDDKLRYSARKLNYVVEKIRGKYLIDAERILENDYSKGSKYIQHKLREFLEKNKEELDKEEYVLRVKQAFVGKKNNFKLPMYRAKGRVNFIQRKLCSFTIQFEKVNKEDFCKNLASGEITYGYRQLFRQVLYKSRANYDTLKNLSFVTNLRAMLTRKKMIQGLVKEIKLKYINQTGVELADWAIQQELLKDLGNKFLPLYDNYLKKPEKLSKEDLEERNIKKSVKERHSIYSKKLKFD